MHGTTCRPQLVCFSHLRWDFVYQRPQHLLSRAARDHDVYFIEEPVFEASATPHLRTSPRPEGVTVVLPVLPTGSEAGMAEALRPLLRRLLPSGPARRTLWYYTPMAVAFSRDIPADVVVYDNMDELTGFLGAPAHLLALEAELFARADLVFTGGMSLYRAKRHRHPSVHAFPSSIDKAHFARARGAVTEPADQRAIPGPRAGFFGVIDERMDVGLLARTAARCPDWQFVMIGPVVKIDPAALPRQPNIHWLGPKAYRDLPDYIAGWTVGLMPFALNEATRFISPTKTPEFLAAGVPVVSTAITDVVSPYGDKGLVAIAGDDAGLADSLEALRRRPRAAWLAAVDRHLAGMSWDRTWADMQHLMLGVGQATQPKVETARSTARQVMVGEEAHV